MRARNILGLRTIKLRHLKIVSMHAHQSGRLTLEIVAALAVLSARPVQSLGDFVEAALDITKPRSNLVAKLLARRLNFGEQVAVVGVEQFSQCGPQARGLSVCATEYSRRPFRASATALLTCQTAWNDPLNRPHRYPVTGNRRSKTSWLAS